MRTAEFKRHKIPDNCHPLVRWLFEEMNHQQCSLKALAERSGLSYSNIAQWRYRSKPTLENIEACLNALGFDLTARRIRDEAD